MLTLQAMWHDPLSAMNTLILDPLSSAKGWRRDTTCNLKLSKEGLHFAGRTLAAMPSRSKSALQCLQVAIAA